MKFGSAIRLTVVGLAMATAAVVIPAASASAATSAGDVCGFGCDGLDPNTKIYLDGWPAGGTCAADARTIYSVFDGYSTGELRYSPSCETVWARSDNHYASVERKSPSGANHVDGPGYSVMFNDHNLVSRVCIYYPFGGTKCGAWY